MVSDLNIYSRSSKNCKESIEGDYIPGNYYPARSKPPLAKDAVFVRPSREIVAVKKLYDVVFKLLFVTIAVVTLFVETVIDVVISSTSNKPENLNRAC